MARPFVKDWRMHLSDERWWLLARRSAPIDLRLSVKVGSCST